MKHIVLLNVDSLRADRLRLNGYPIDCCPTINRLAETGIACTNTYAHSNVTQFSYPSIFTSTLPLDFGGYDNGIVDRPVTIAEVFQDAGYVTAGFSPSFWQIRETGYARGFTDYYEYLDLPRVWRAFYSVYVRYYENLRKIGTISTADFTETVAPLIKNTFDALIRYCSTFAWAVDPRKAQSVKVRRYQQRLSRYLSSLRDQKNLFLKDPAAYIEERRSDILSGDFDRVLSPSPASDRSASASSGSGLFRKAGHSTVFQVLTRGLHPALPLPLRGTLLLSNMADWIDRHRSQQTFTWVEIDELHDRAYGLGQWSFLCNPRVMSREQKLHPEATLKHLLYDFSLRHVDKLIARFLDTLRRRDLLDDCLIVVFGDHGSDVGATRKKTGEFYEADVRVPIIFWNRKFSQRTISHFSALIDLAPSLCDLAGINHPPEFQGVSVLSSRLQDRDHVILENAGAGPCDLRRKRIRICIRHEQYKYIAREKKPEGEPVEFDDEEFYDTNADPSDTQNLISKEEFKNLAEKSRGIARNRIMEIRSTAPQ